MAGERGIDPERHAQLRKEYGFDRPVLVQYGIYIARVLHGDLGKSIDHAGAGADANSRRCFPATIELALCAILFALVHRHAGRHASRRSSATRSSTTA